MLAESAPNTGNCLCAIPGGLSVPDSYLLRIASVSDPGANDLSDASFTVDQIRIISPGDLTTIAPSNTVRIEWAFGDPNQAITIELFKGAEKLATIAQNLTNATHYDWVTPIGLQEGSDYFIRVRSASQSSFSGDSPTFAVGSFGISSPNGGEALKPGTTVTIGWFSSASDPVKIELLKGGSIHSTISGSTSDKDYSWTVPAEIMHGNDYAIRITSTGSVPLVAASNAFSIGSIAVSSPNGANVWVAGEQYTLSWSSALGGTVDIILLRNGSPDAAFSSIAASTENDGVYHWTIPSGLTESSTFKVRVRSSVNPEIFDDSDGTFTIGTLNINAASLPLALKPGSAYAILWESLLGGNVDIDLYAGGTKAGDIATIPTGNGTYTWTAGTAGQPEGPSFRIRLTLQSSGLPAIYRETEDLSIGTINIGALARNVWKTGETMSLSWSSAIAGNAVVDLYKASVKVATIATVSASEHSYTWTVSRLGQAEGVDYKIRISSSLNPAIYSESAAFSIGGISINSPNSGAYWTGAPCTVSWTSAILGNVDIDLYRAGSKVKDIAIVAASGGSYAWSDFSSITANTGYYLRASSETNASIYAESGQFALGGITSTLASGLSAGSPETIALSWSSVIGGNVDIDLYKGASKLSDIIVTSNSGSYSWTVPTGLDAGGDYTFRITSTINTSITGTSEAFAIKRWVPYGGTEGVVTTSSTSSLSLAIRSDNSYPIVLTRDTSNYLHLYKWTGSGWDYFTKDGYNEVKPYADTVSEAALCLNSYNEPVIGFIPVSSGRLSLVKWVSGTTYYGAGLGTAGVVSNMSKIGRASCRERV